MVDLNDGVFAEPVADFGFIDQMPSLPKCLQRALKLNPRRPSSILTLLLGTQPGKEDF